MAIYDEIESKGLYGGVKAGAPLSTEEAQSLGLPQLNPLQDELERIYRKHVTENPEQNAAHVWNAQRVGVPQWIQDRDEMYKKEAEYRLALLDKGSPDWNRMVAFSPATSKFLQHDDVMASAYDDVDNLAAMEKESKRAAMVKENLNGLLQRGASGRMAIMRKLKADIKPSDIVPVTSDTAKGTGSMYGLEADTFNGMLESGNIDINNRPVVHNEDGSISTVRSISVDFDGKTYLIPTIADDGRELSFENAVQMFKDTGKHLGIFENDKAATEYAKALSARQGKIYGAGPRIGRDADTSQFKNPFTAVVKGLEETDRKINEFVSATAPGEGWVEGWLEGFEMSELGKTASRLFDAEAAGAPKDESKWVSLEKRMAAMGRKEPKNLRDYLLFATAKFGGQQQSGIQRTLGLTAGMLAIAGLMAATAPVSVPGAMLATAGTPAAATIGAGITAASIANMGRALGMGMQVYETERGLDILQRRMLKDKDGNYIPDEAAMAGSTTVGAANAIWEFFQWELFLGSFGKTPVGKKVVDKVLPKVAAQIGKLPSVAKTVGRIGTQFVLTDFLESFTEVLQDAGPIAIDELQKHALLGGHDAISMGEAMNRLTDTFRQSAVDFSLISAVGPVVGGIRGDHHIELVRKEMEAKQVQQLNSNMDNFTAKIGASKLIQRIPGMSKDFANELLDGADARTVYVPATSVQQMFQDGLIETEQGDAAAWAEEALGVDPEDFRASLDGGPDIEIEAIKLFDSVPDKAQDAIRKSMRFSADGMTLGEAEAMNDRITKIRQGDLFDVSYELEREVSEAASAQKVFESMRLQMEAQGMDHEIAANTAWAASRMYIPMARMWNERRTSQDMIMPEDVAEMFPISFTRNDDGSMGMYFQALGERGAGQLDAADMVTMRLDNLAAAKKELAAGKSPLKVKMAYGWEQGADGKWRMETDDSNFTLKAMPGTREWRDLFSNTEKYGPKRYALLKDVIFNDDLFNAYPEMRDMRLYVDIDDEKKSGYYSVSDNSIHLSYDAAVNLNLTKAVLLHEIQHAVQTIEGFAPGGSPVSLSHEFFQTQQYKDALEVYNHIANFKFFPKFFNYLEFKKGRGIFTPWGVYITPWHEDYKKYADPEKLKNDFDKYKEEDEHRHDLLVKEHEYDGKSITDQLQEDYEDYDKKLTDYQQKYDSDAYQFIMKENSLSTQYAFDKYKRLSGEVEARNVERRIGMSAAERRASLLSETEDVSREDQILLDSMLRKAELAEELRYFQSVYHGSPHRFDRFTLNKIGTGEGNQAFGWGLYFTEKQKIARDYRNALIERYGKSMSDLKFSGKTAMEWYKHFERLAARAGSKEAKPFYDIMSMLEDFEITWDSQSIVDRIKIGKITSDPEFDYDPYAVEWFTKNIHNSELKPGAIYKVELPDDSGQYLYWDKPLNEQSETIKKAWEESKISEKSIYELRILKGNENALKNGDEFYSELAANLGSDKAASLWLNEHGVVGIKYLDGTSRSQGEGSYNYVIFDENAVNILETYNQAQMNRDVDLSRKIPILDLTDERDIASDITIQDITNYLKVLAADNAEFNDLLSDALISIINTKVRPKTDKVKRKIRDIGSHLSTSGGHVSKGSKDLRKAALIAVDKLINHSVLIESLPNYKAEKKPDVAMYHYLYTPVSIMENGKQKTYTLQIIAEEDINKQGRNPLKLDLYDLSIRKKISPLRAALPSSQGQPMWQPGDTEISIGEMLHKVKNFWGEDLNQPHRGSITFPRQQGQPIRISWSKNADASTVIHELAHFYLWQLRQFRGVSSAADALTGRYTGQAMGDLDIISNWWSEDAQQITDWIQKQAGMSEMVKAGATEDNFINWINSGMERESELGKAFDVAAHEYFARGFEAYMREGKAPTAELQSVFRRFKKWLIEIYKSLTELNVELSDDVRAVYDRMLASEEAIEQFRAEMEVEDLLKSEEGYIPEDLPFDENDPFEAAKERLLGILMDEISSENRKKMISRADEIRPRILAETMSEKGWAAVEFYKENPEHRISESSILDRYGEKVLESMPPDSVDTNGITVEIAAKDMGYGSADELIQDLQGKGSLKNEVDARVRAQIEREFSSIINAPAKLDSAVEAAWYEGEEHADDLAADIVVPMSEYAGIYAEDEAAAAEQESPRNRRNVIGWIKSHGGLLYSSVSTEFGKERAQELIKKTGPGIFSKTGFGLDELAQEMSGNGIPVDSDEDLFNILMGEDAKQSPLDIAREEGRAEALKEAKMKRALDMMVKAEKKRLGKEIKQRYDEQIKGVKSAAETAAENIVGIMPIEKLPDTAKYIRAEKEARRKADAALRKNDEIEFRRWRERELMQHMIVKQMYRSQRQAEGIRSWLERYAKRTNTQTFGMTPNFIEQVDAILTRFDIRKTRSMTAKQRAMVGEAPSLDNFIREMDAEGSPILIDDWIIQTQERRHYTQLMLWQFKEVQNAVKNIVTVGRQEKQTIALMQNEKLSDIADKIYSAAKAFYGEKVTGEKILDPEEIKKNIVALAGGALADIETVEAMCRALDGYVDMGPAQRYIFQPIRAAMTRETLELNRVFSLARDMRSEAYGGSKIDNWSKTFDDIYKYKEVTLPNGKVKYVPTDQKLTLTREMAISAVLNMGNEGNRSRLMTGWGWTNENMAEILGALNEQDIKYVQGIWNLVESLWPQVKKVHELMTGLTLEKVDATPLETKYGKITGGYYPIVTDLRYSTQAAAQTELETALTSTTLGFAHTYTKSGHRKLRAVDVEGRPPLLSLSVLDNHLANVIHDFEVAPALRDVRKILRHPIVETTIDQVLGKKRRQNINKWLNDVAGNTKNNGIALSGGDWFANKLISGTAMYTLGANLGGSLMQPLGYFALAHRIGSVHTARAILYGLKDNRALYEFVLEKSDFMREQYTGQNVEVRRARENWSSQSGGLKWWQDAMLSIYPLMQNLCNVPGWAECYKMGIEKFNGNEADAIAFADSIIRQTQSASNLADLTTFERSGTWQRWASMFFSWFRVMYQMQNEAIMRTIYGHGLKGRFGDLASYAFYILICQSVAEALLRGYGPDDDDDDDGEAEKWVKWTAKQAFLSPLSTVPLVRDIARGAEIGRYTFSPAEASLRSIFKLIQAADKVIEAEPEDRDLEPLVWSGAEVVGYGTGLPNRAMLRAAKAFWELYNEDEAIPWAYVILGGGFRPKK